MAKIPLYQELERLKAVNKELVEACKTVEPLLYLLEDKISMTKLCMFKQAIKKAEQEK